MGRLEENNGDIGKIRIKEGRKKIWLKKKKKKKKSGKKKKIGKPKSGFYQAWSSIEVTALSYGQQIRAATDRSVACSVAAGIRHRPAIRSVPGCGDRPGTERFWGGEWKVSRRRPNFNSALKLQRRPSDALKTSECLGGRRLVAGQARGRIG